MKIDFVKIISIAAVFLLFLVFGSALIMGMVFKELASTTMNDVCNAIDPDSTFDGFSKIEDVPVFKCKTTYATYSISGEDLNNIINEGIWNAGVLT
jgi:hypothetical protein